MKTLFALTERNVKVFFKDKGAFLSAMIAPLVLFLLFITFLGDSYRQIFEDMLGEQFTPDGRVVEGFVGGWLMSSLLAVSGVTVAFCVNMQMVNDKITGSIQDFTVSPVKRSTVSLSYYLGTAIATAIICFVVLGVGLIYLACVGWYLSFTDILLCIVDILLTVLFGTALSSIVCCFLKSQGAMSAVGVLVSAIYGFICGAYMPIAQFNEGVRDFISLLPGTYATGLFRNHFMGGVLEELSKTTPAPVVEAVRDGFDCNMYCFGNQITVPVMYGVLLGTVALLIGVYVLINFLRRKKV